MAGFVYRMQNILDIKYKLEDQKKQEYAQIQAKLNEAEAYLQNLEQRLVQDIANLRTATSSKLDLLEIESCKNAITFRRDQIAAQKQMIASLRGEVERARIRLNKAMQERKMHEKLRENQFEEFMHEMNQKESKEIDELVSYSFSKAEDSIE
ncbi:MAG: flagellar export protein FliJ [Lachnospiraceae bacterium]|nr:flagellar export protein FliJ [Lachnospiraceae bacterium]